MACLAPHDEARQIGRPFLRRSETSVLPNRSRSSKKSGRCLYSEGYSASKPSMIVQAELHALNNT